MEEEIAPHDYMFDIGKPPGENLDGEWDFEQSVGEQMPDQAESLPVEPEDVAPEVQGEVVLPNDTVPVAPTVPYEEVPEAQPSDVQVAPTMPNEGVPNAQAPVEVVPTPVADSADAQSPSSTMPPPLVPTSSQIPAVKLLPPTPNTSQEATTSGPSTLLEVPVPTLPPRPTRSQSRSPAPEASPRRRSPRLGSPAPGSKRPPPGPLEGPATKKPRDQ